MSAPDTLDGASLLSFVSEDNAPERPAFGQTDYPLHFGWSPLRSVRANDYKLIEAPRPELYDLHTDPAESKNLYESSGSPVLKIRSSLAEMGRKASIPPIPAQDLLLPDPKDRIEEQNLLHAAMLAQEDSRMEDVRVVLKKVLQLDPKSWTALRQLGELELQAGDYKEAALHLKASHDLRPEDATIALQEGQALVKNGDMEGARAVLEASLKTDPGQYAGHVLLGKIDIGLKDIDAAEDQFDAALLLEPDGVEAQLGASQAEIARGNLPDAAEQLQSLSKTYPSNPEIFELLAQVYQRMNKPNEANQAREKAKALLQEQNP
jgi:predicted Zn-dependent protease